MQRFGKIGSYYQDKASHDRVLRRIGYLECVYEDMVLSLSLPKGLFRLNKAVLTNVTYSYFYDVERLKHFHDIQRVNGYKQASYMIKWLSKLKPIMFDDSEVPQESIRDIYLCINEVYAMKTGLAMAQISVSKVSSEAMEKMLYTLRLRNIDEHMLVMLLEALDD